MLKNLNQADRLKHAAPDEAAYWKDCLGNYPFSPIPFSAPPLGRELNALFVVNFCPRFAHN
jgi:hypothetical protein